MTWVDFRQFLVLSMDSHAPCFDSLHSGPKYTQMYHKSMDDGVETKAIQVKRRTEAVCVSRPKLTWEKVILYVDLEKIPQVYVIYHFKSVFLKILFLFSSKDYIGNS